MLPVAYLLVSKPDYSEFISVCVDGSGFPSDYSVYLQRLAQFADSVKKEGQVAVEIPVTAAEFVAWCGPKGKRTDHNSRKEYAAFRNFQLNNQNNGSDYQESLS